MASQAHCACCFESLSASFDKRAALNLATTERLWAQYQDSLNRDKSEVSKNALNGASRHNTASKFPLFVTWDTKSKNGHKSLRGCIGTFEAQELKDGLGSYALTS